MLRVALINGSPKYKDSASDCLLEELKEYLVDAEVRKIELHTPVPAAAEEAALLDSDVFVFSFPLYVDGIPSHLLHCLTGLERLFCDKGCNIRVYAIANCGFYEAHQNRHALQLMKNWCARANLHWGQGVNVGAGGMVLSIRSVPPGVGPKKKLTMALQELAANIKGNKESQDIYVTPGFPRFLYKASADLGWGQAIKANGLKPKDLNRRPAKQ
jgi:hypothetical protein